MTLTAVNADGEAQQKGARSAIPSWISEQFEEFERTLNGGAASGIHNIRKRALSRLGEMGIPTPKTEEWKYTNLAPLSKASFARPQANSDSSPIPLQVLTAVGLNDSALPRLVFVDGVYSQQLSSSAGLPRGVRVRSLREVFAAAATDPDRAVLDRHLTRHARYEEQALVALNTAFLDDGALVCIDRGAVVEKQIALVFVVTAQCRDIAVYPRVMIAAGQQSQATVVEYYTSLTKERYLTAAVSEIFVEEGAIIDHYRVQLESKAAIHLSTTEIVQQRKSTFSTHSFSFGGALVRNDVNPTLNGEGIDSTLNGLTVIGKDQHVDNHTVIDHAQPHSVSNELYKGIYAANAHGVFNGTIIVRPDAQKTNAIQSNQSLLLSQDAAIDSKPQLKIWADDVRCTHGATVGQLSDDALFYLRSRGIARDQAQHMLIRGFAADLIEGVRPDGLGDFLEQTLLAKLEQLSSQNEPD